MEVAGMVYVCGIVVAFPCLAGTYPTESDLKRAAVRCFIWPIILTRSLLIETYRAIRWG